MQRHDYIRQCIEIAKSALRDAEGNLGMSVPELIELSVDSHVLVQHSGNVINNSRHLGAYFEDVGELRTRSIQDCMNKIATYALRADVYDYLPIARKELDRQAAE